MARLPSSDRLQVLVVVLDPAMAAVQAESAGTILRTLGHDVVLSGYDLAEADSSAHRFDAVIVEAGTHLEIARDAIRRLRNRTEIAHARMLLCVEVGRVAGLDPEFGADDFILMPIVARELLTRLSQLRWRELVGEGGRVIRRGHFVLDCVSLNATYQGQPLKLTPYEFQLLKFLMERAGVVFSREELLTRVWGYRHVGRVRTVDTHILNLRSKLGPAGDIIEAVRGMGYKLRKSGEDGVWSDARHIA